MSLLYRSREPLDRRPASERPAKFILAVEGPKTEPAYFAAYFELFRSTRIDTTVLPPVDNKSSPNHVASNLIEHCREQVLIEGLDELWLVIDVDQHEEHGHLSAVATQAKSHGYRLAVSHPCFEAWLLLHVGDDIDQLTASKIASKKAKSRMKHVRQTTPGWHGHIDPRLLDGVPDAVTRARARREREPDPQSAWPTTPGSDVYRLIERFAEQGVVHLDVSPVGARP